MKTTASAIQAHEQESLVNSIDQVGIGVIAVLSAVIGTWGVACLIGGISQYGIVGLAKAWFTAVVG